MVFVWVGLDIEESFRWFGVWVINLLILKVFDLCLIKRCFFGFSGVVVEIISCVLIL